MTVVFLSAAEIIENRYIFVLRFLTLFYFSGTKASLKIVQVGSWMLWASRRYTNSFFLLETLQSLLHLSLTFSMKIRFVYKLLLLSSNSLKIVDRYRYVESVCD